MRVVYKVLAGAQYKDLGYMRGDPREEKIKKLFTQLRALGVEIRSPDASTPASSVLPCPDLDFSLDAAPLAGLKVEPTTGLEPVTYALRSQRQGSANTLKSQPSRQRLPEAVEQISQEIAENISVILRCAQSACSANAPRGPSRPDGRSRRRGGSS